VEALGTETIAPDGEASTRVNVEDIAAVWRRSRGDAGDLRGGGGGGALGFKF
jgi:hypothetical protein